MAFFRLSRPLPIFAVLAGALMLTAAAKAQSEDPDAATTVQSSETDRPPPNVGTAECAWIGQRILVLLWRDDIDTANDFFTVYDRFRCPMGHAGYAFRCLVSLGETADDSEINLPDRARACWENPALDPADYTPPGEIAPEVE